jgi:starch-binding outer membrane protein, SusD/RagB family
MQARGWRTRSRSRPIRGSGRYEVIKLAWYGSGNAYQMRPEQALRLEAQAGDERVEFRVEPAAFAGANGKTLDELARYVGRAENLPVYFPDEMRWIRAEVHARAGRLPEAIALINDVRTRCSSALEEPVACLPPVTAVQLPTEEAVLDEILRQRRFELFLQGLRYSDLRRFQEPLSFEWIPLPNIECSRNPELGC